MAAIRRTRCFSNSSLPVLRLRRSTLLFLLLLCVSPPGCGESGDAVSPSALAKPPTPEEIEAKVRKRLDIPDASRVVAVFGMTSHWDINWLKTFGDYYRDSVEKIIAKALDLLDTDPSYTYAISEVEFLDRYWVDHPEDQPRIKEHASSGRLRIVGGGITSPDTFLPPAELLLRDWLLGNRWCLDNLGLKPLTAWQPDSFGHSPSLPAILDAVGYRYLSFARVDGAPTYVPRRYPSPRPLPGTTAEFLEEAGVSDFFWTFDDGTRVLSHWMYDGYAVADGIDVEPPGLALVLNFIGIDPESTPFWKPDEAKALTRMAEYIDRLEPMRNTPYVFVPIGIDFAFPKARMADYIAAWNRDRYPATGIYCVFAPFEDYIQMVGGRHASLPVYSLDITPLFMGFFTTKPALKIHQRQAMEGLLAAEKLAAFAQGLGLPYPEAELDRAWRLAVRCNHHDGVTGTSTDLVYQNEQLPEIQNADTSAGLLAGNLLAGLADQVDTSGGSGGAVIVFNPLSWERSDWVEVSTPVSGTGIRSVRIHEPGGAEVPAQLLRSRTHPDGSLAEATIGFVAGEIPPTGWLTYYLAEDPRPYPGYPTSLDLQQGAEALELENRFYRARLDLRQGACLTSLVEKASGREFLAGPGNDVVVWKDLGGLYRLGNEIQPNGLEETFATSSSASHQLRILERGPQRLLLEIETSWQKPILRELVLYDLLPRIDAAGTVQAPLETALTVRFPTTVRDGRLTMAIPGGEVVRAEQKAFEPTFWPGIEWADLAAAGQGSGFAMTARGSRGWRYTAAGLLECMLHRNALIELPTILGPPGTDFATHTIRYALYPASGGDWIARRVWMPGRGLDAPLTAALTGIHAGALSPSGSIVSVDDPRAEVTALKRWEAGGRGLCLRIQRQGAEAITARVTLGLPGTWTVLEADASETRTGGVLGASPTFPLRLDKRLTTVKLEP